MVVASIAPVPRFAERMLNKPATASITSADASTMVDSALIDGDTPNFSCPNM